MIPQVRNTAQTERGQARRDPRPGSDGTIAQAEAPRSARARTIGAEARMALLSILRRQHRGLRWEIVDRARPVDPDPVLNGNPRA